MIALAPGFDFLSGGTFLLTRDIFFHRDIANIPTKHPHLHIEITQLLGVLTLLSISPRVATFHFIDITYEL